MTSRLSAFAVLLLAALPVACSDSRGTPTSPSGAGSSLSLTAEQLSGAWRLTSVQAAGQAAQLVPAGADYTLSFADGRISTRADCNTCGGSFTLSGTTIAVGPALACTRAACPTMAFETTYTSILTGEHTVTRPGNTLVLSSARGVLSFGR